MEMINTKRDNITIASFLYLIMWYQFDKSVNHIMIDIGRLSTLLMPNKYSGNIYA